MKKILSVIIVFVFSGCALYPPPDITDHYYKNYEYEFGFEIQDGWHVSELNNDIKKLYGDPKGVLKSVQLTLIDRETTSVMVVTSGKCPLDPDILAYIGDKKLRELYRKRFEGYKKKLESALGDDGNIEKYRYFVHQLRCYDGPCLTGTIDGKYTFKDVHYDGFSELFTYRCHKDDECLVSFTVINPNGELENSVIKSFNKMTSTLVRNVVAETK